MLASSRLDNRSKGRNVRQIHRIAAAMGIAFIGVVGLELSAGAASANYAGTTTTTTTVPTTTPPTVVPGTSPNTYDVTVGNSVAGQICPTPPFTDGATVSFFIGTTPAGTGTASGGCVNFTGTASDPHLSINGGPAIAVVYGANTVTATGADATGGTGLRPGLHGR
jgi:hypothetical protein